MNSITYTSRATASRRLVNNIFSSCIGWLSPTIYAFLLFSTFSVKIFDIAGNYLFEAALLVAIAWACLARDPIARSIVRAVRRHQVPVLIAFTTITVLFLIGGLVGGNAIYSYGDYRANLVILAGFLVCREFIGRDPLPIIQLGIATGVFSAIGWYFNITGDTASSKFASPYVCMLVAIILACQTRRVMMASLALLILVFLAAVSFYRQYWISALCGVIYVLAYGLSQFGSRARLRLATICVLGTIAGLFAFPSYISTVENFFIGDESHYIQGVGKTQNIIDAAINGNGTLQQSDETRLSYFTFAFTEPWKVLLPHGLGYRAFYNDIDPFFDKSNVDVTTIDSLFFYMAFHYGLLLTIPILLWIVRGLWLYRSSNGTLPALCVAAVVLIALLFDGGQAVIIDRAFWLGMLVGCIGHSLRIRWRYE